MISSDDMNGLIIIRRNHFYRRTSVEEIIFIAGNAIEIILSQDNDTDCATAEKQISYQNIPCEIIYRTHWFCTNQQYLLDKN